MEILNYESAIRGDFGTSKKQDWEKYKKYEEQRLIQYPIEDFDPDVLEITNEIEENSYIILKNAFDTTLLDELRDEVNHMMENGLNQKAMAGALVGREEDIKDKCLWSTINQPLMTTKSTLKIFTHDIFVTIAAHYFKCLPTLGTLNLRRSFANDLKDEHTLLFHQDPNSPNFLKAFLYLNDVDEDGGPFCIVKGSHKNKLKTSYDKYHYTNEEIEEIYGKENVKYYFCKYKRIS